MLLSAVLLCTGSATVSADESIVIDLVRHGRSVANAAGLIDTSVPGAALTAPGREQAQTGAAGDTGRDQMDLRTGAPLPDV